MSFQICYILSGIKALDAKLRQIDEAKFVDNDFTDYDTDPVALLRFKRKSNLGTSYNGDVKANNNISHANALKSQKEGKNIKSRQMIVRPDQNVSNKVKPIDSRELEYSYDEEDQLLLPSREDLNTLRKKRQAVNSAHNNKQTRDGFNNNNKIKRIQNDRNAKLSRRKFKLDAHDRARINQQAKELRAIKLERKRVKQRYQEKINEIMTFLKPNYITTNYIYDEMNRIQKQGEQGDRLIMLVEYLDRPELGKLRNSVLKCFWDETAKEKPPPRDLWKGRVPNNLAINPMKDPYLYE